MIGSAGENASPADTVTPEVSTTSKLQGSQMKAPQEFLNSGTRLVFLTTETFRIIDTTPPDSKPITIRLMGPAECHKFGFAKHLPAFFAGPFILTRPV
jgi:hypothetical protein